MKKNLINKLTALIITTVVCTGTLYSSINTIAYENNREINEFTIYSQSKIDNETYRMVSREEFEEMKKEVYQYLVLNEDGTISLSTKTPRSLVNEYSLEALQEHFNYLNEKVKNGEITINPDFTINQHIETYAGIDKEETYWWGVSEWSSYSSARKKAQVCTKIANGLSIASDMTSVFNKIASIVLDIGDFYYSRFADNINYINEGNGQRGIVIDMNWAAIYSIYSQ